jgi:hypothetical protein
MFKKFLRIAMTIANVIPVVVKAIETIIDIVQPKTKPSYA